MKKGVAKMPLLQVRDCPEDIYQEIRLAAQRENRTIAQQTVVLLQRGLGQTESNMERSRRVLEEINNRIIPEKAKQIDIEALIREDRDR